MNQLFQMPLLSVIVPTYHRNDLLAICLKLLSSVHQALGSENYEVIVTDDGKAYSAKEMIAEQFPWAKWVEGPHKGPAANRNNGAKHANGEWLIFTDDDCLPQKDLLSTYVKAIQTFPNALAFEGAIEPEIYNEDVHNPRFECPVNTEGNNFWSANIAVKSDLFKAIGGFDENYPLAALEDQDIFYRLQEKTEIPFLRQAVVLHPLRTVSYRKKVRRIPAMAKNWSYHALKHKKRLGYSSKTDILLDSVLFYCRDSVRQMYKGKVIVSLFDLFYLTYGNWCLMINLWKNQSPKTTNPFN